MPHDDRRRMGRRVPQQLTPLVRAAHVPEAAGDRSVAARLHRHARCPGPNHDLIPEHIRWWDRWLKGLDNGIDREPPIVLFAQRSTLPAPDRAEVRGDWRYEPTWPAERLRPTEWKLADAARRSRSPRRTGLDELDVRGDVGHTAWISCAGVMPWGQPDDQRPDELHSLTYTWEPLEHELEILGQARVRVRVTSSAPVAYLSAKLCDVFPDGTSSLVAQGHAEPHPALVAGTSVGARARRAGRRGARRSRRPRGRSSRATGCGSISPAPTGRTPGLRLSRSRSRSIARRHRWSFPCSTGRRRSTERPSLAPPFLGRPRRGGHRRRWRTRACGGRSRTRPSRASRRPTPAARSRRRRTGTVPAMRSHYDGVVSVSTVDPGRAVARGEAEFEMRWPEATVIARAECTIDERCLHLPHHDRPHRARGRRGALPPTVGTGDPARPHVAAGGRTDPGNTNPRRAGRGSVLMGYPDDNGTRSERERQCRPHVGHATFMSRSLGLSRSRARPGRGARTTGSLDGCRRAPASWSRS